MNEYDDSDEYDGIQDPLPGVEVIRPTRRTCGAGRGPNWAPIPALTKIPSGQGHSREYRRIVAANRKWSRLSEAEREKARAELRAWYAPTRIRLTWEAVGAEPVPEVSEPTAPPENAPATPPACPIPVGQMGEPTPEARVPEIGEDCPICGGSGTIYSRAHLYTCPECGPDPILCLDGVTA